MAKRLTIVVDDELYAAVTAEAARLHRPLKDVVADALREWLEALEDAELIPLVEESRADWEKHGGIELSELIRQLDEENRESRAV
jgi:Arc/MetJ family transcription regulator